MNRTVAKHLLVLGSVFLVLGLGSATVETRLLRYPDIQRNMLDFCYGGNIYSMVFFACGLSPILNAMEPNHLSVRHVFRYFN